MRDVNPKKPLQLLAVVFFHDVISQPIPIYLPVIMTYVLPLFPASCYYLSYNRQTVGRFVHDQGTNKEL